MMVKPANKKTKVRALKAKSTEENVKSKRLKDLQKAIDQGCYKTSASDIAKAYLYKASHEFNTFPSDKDNSEDLTKVKKPLKSIK
jgi:hypothetical protein